jgi:hypothetical protein
MDSRDSEKTASSDGQFGSYKPPQVERVVTSTDLEREGLYAGAQQTPGAQP